MSSNTSSSSQPSINSVHSLFQGAQAGPGQKGMSQSTTEILVQNLTPTTLAGTQGANYDTLATDKAFLFVPVLDMTGSMNQFRYNVIDAYNVMLNMLQNSKQADQMLLSTWTFNTCSYLLHGYTPIELAPRLTASTYQPDNQTALYDAILDAITGVVAYGQELRNQGARTKITLVVFTDGYDNSSRNTASTVRRVVEDLIAQEMYTFALVGFGSGFANKTAQHIGFTNVMEADADPSAIRHALEVVSNSVIRASQTIMTGSSPNSFFS
jgi:hypothetical protein